MRTAARWFLSESRQLRRVSSTRSGEMDAKTIFLIVLAGVGGIALFVCAGFVLLLLPAVQGARNAARVTQSKNNLQQIGLALHNYHDVMTVFPPGGIYTEDETPYHSWQTMLLPYVDQEALYEVIDFDRPWTDPRNAPVFKTFVATFLNAHEPGAVRSAGGASSHYAANQHVLHKNSSTRMRDVTDGTANTLLAGEVAAGFRAWGDPQNVRNPADGIHHDGATFGGTGTPDSCRFVLVDGSVRTLSSDIDPDVLKALSSPAAGDEVPADF